MCVASPHDKTLLCCRTCFLVPNTIHCTPPSSAAAAAPSPAPPGPPGPWPTLRLGPLPLAPLPARPEAASCSSLLLSSRLPAVVKEAFFLSHCTLEPLGSSQGVCCLHL